MPLIEKTLQNSRLYARLRDHQFSLYEDYARKQGLQGKSLLILLWIYRNPRGISQKTIGERTYSSKQVTNATIRSFMEKGYIEARPYPADRRRKLLTLTEAGRRFAAAVIDPIDAAETRALDRLSAKKQEALLEETTAFTKALTEEFSQLNPKEKKHDRI